MADEPLRLMAVLAHPDDESLGVGGVLARYAAEGVETHVVTATRGERGRFRAGEPRPSDAEVGRVREGELRAAAGVLGVRTVRLLGYRDRDLELADPEEVVGRIVAHLRRVRPHVVVTFGPDGAYGHPDHIAICQATSAALVAAADPGHVGIHAGGVEAAGGAEEAQAMGAEGSAGAGAPHVVSKLYYLAWSADIWAAYQAALKRLVTVVDGEERQAQPWPDWAITAWVDTRDHWRTVWRAVQCHETQMSIYASLGDLPPEHHAALWGRQQFYRALSLVNGGPERETDLFEGLR